MNLKLQELQKAFEELEDRRKVLEDIFNEKVDEVDYLLNQAADFKYSVKELKSEKEEI